MSVIISLRPITEYVSRRIGLRVNPIFDMARESQQISPEISIEEMPAISLEGELDRVEAFRHYGTREEQAAVLNGGLCRHLPTIAYRFDDALLADGVVYAGKGSEKVAARPRRPVLVSSAQDFHSAMLCADIGSDMFFGRWLCDSLSKELLASELGLTPIGQSQPQRLHEPGYRALMDLHAASPAVARIRDLWLVDDRGYNADHIRRFKVLRGRLSCSKEQQRPRYVYISRGQIAVAGRSLQNENEVEAALSSQGFTVIHPEMMEPAAICSALSGATIVVAVEGSALAHAQIAMPEGGAIITIQPANRFSSAHKSVGEAAGLRFGYVVADSRNGQLAVDIKRLLKTIDLVASMIS